MIKAGRPDIVMTLSAKIKEQRFFSGVLASGEAVPGAEGDLTTGHHDSVPSIVVRHGDHHLSYCLQ